MYVKCLAHLDDYYLNKLYDILWIFFGSVLSSPNNLRHLESKQTSNQPNKFLFPTGSPLPATP